MGNIETLRKLIDEDAITFIKANKENYDIQFNSFVNMNNITNINGREYMFGVDLAYGKDMSIVINADIVVCCP